MNSQWKKHFLEEGNPDWQDTLGCPLLHKAAARNYPTRVQALIEANCNVDVRVNGQTAVFAAIRGGDEEGNVHCIQLLLGAGCPIEAKDNQGRTALMYSVEFGRVNCIRVLLEEGCTRSLGNSLFAALRSGRTAGVLAVIDAGCLETDIMNVLMYNNGGATLIQASRNGYHECVDILIQFGCPLDHQMGPNGTTALIAAASNNEPECVRLLIEAKCNVHLTKNNGWTALVYAATEGYKRCTRLLLEAESRVDLLEDPKILSMFTRQRAQGTIDFARGEMYGDFVAIRDQLADILDYFPLMTIECICDFLFELQVSALGRGQDTAFTGDYTWLVEFDDRGCLYFISEDRLVKRYCRPERHLVKPFWVELQNERTGYTMYKEIIGGLVRSTPPEDCDQIQTWKVHRDPDTLRDLYTNTETGQRYHI